MTAGTRVRSHGRKLLNACAVGSRTPNMPIHGACARPSFGRRASVPPGSLTVPASRVARRLVEQQTQEPPRREPQQEHHRQPEQQQRFPYCPHARRWEPGSPRRRRASERASRDDHDENWEAFLLLRISGGGTPAAPVCKLSIIGWPHAGAFSDGLRVRCRVPRWRFQRA